MTLDNLEKRMEKKKVNNLIASFDDMVEEAEAMGPMMQCDLCREYWPVDNFDKQSFVHNGGELVCDSCASI